jgi:hypothetical protein
VSETNQLYDDTYYRLERLISDRIIEEREITPDNSSFDETLNRVHSEIVDRWVQ